MRFEDLYETVTLGWDFGRKNYPLGPAPEEDQKLRAFTLQHVTSHLAKTTGKLAAMSEPLDHGGEEPNTHEVARQVAYAIINAMRFASLCGVTPGQILYHIQDWRKENDK